MALVLESVFYSCACHYLRFMEAAFLPEMRHIAKLYEREVKATNRIVCSSQVYKQG